ncbi:biotin carboxylase N-terminal domain-containing protein, partial [Isoptericola haloaureus]
DLDPAAGVAAAVASGAEAAHPGHGSLSENPAPARACAEVGNASRAPPVAATEPLAGPGPRPPCQAHRARARRAGPARHLGPGPAVAAPARPGAAAGHPRCT